MGDWNMQIVLGVLAFAAVVGLGGAIVLGRAASRSIPIRARLRDEPASPIDLGERDEDRSAIQRLLRGLGSFVSPKGPSAELKLSLSRAGYSTRNAPLVFLGVKVMCFTAALAGMIFLMGTLNQLHLMPKAVSTLLQIILVLIGAMVGMIAPNFFLSARRMRRQREVRAYLPDAVDLLEICVSAGMGLDMAWRAVMEQVRRVSVVMADEMSLTDMEINLGGLRAMALRHMAERTGAEELNWLVSSFVQSERFGTSMSETLRNFAASMREDRMRRAEEAAEKMAVKILFPLVVFIFPTIIIVCAGPAGLKIMAAFSSE